MCPPSSLPAQCCRGHNTTRVTGKWSTFKNIFYCKASSFKTENFCYLYSEHTGVLGETAVYQHTPCLRNCPSAIFLLGREDFVAIIVQWKIWLLLADAQPLRSNYCLLFILQWLLRAVESLTSLLRVLFFFVVGVGVYFVYFLFFFSVIWWSRNLFLSVYCFSWAFRKLC